MYQRVYLRVTQAVRQTLRSPLKPTVSPLIGYIDERKENEMKIMDFDKDGNIIEEGDYSVYMKSPKKIAIRLKWHYGEEKVFNKDGSRTFQRFDCFVRGAPYGYHDEPAHPLYQKMITAFLAAV